MPKSKGFTLIELLVVITIIAVLSVAGLVAFQNIRQKTLEAKSKTDINAISKAYEAKFDPTLNGGQGGYRPLTGDDFASGGIPTPDGTTNTSYFVAGPSVNGSTNTAFKICAPLPNNPNPSCSSTSTNCYCATSTQGDSSIISALNALDHPSSCDPNGTLSSGLMGYWKMDESSWAGVSGEVKDTTLANNGTAVGGASTTVGKFDSAGSFDGSNDFVEVNSSIGNMGTNPFSVSFWAKNSLPPGGYHIILGKHGGSWTDPGWFISARNDGYTLFYVNRDLTNEPKEEIRGAHANVNALFPQDSWYHIVGVRQDQTLFLYLNGQLAMQRNHINFGDNISSPISLKLAALPDGWGFWAGQLDDVRIYNRVLSEDEIQKLFEGCVP